jgi:predicted TIM-barrel fold metal-dependent hydrolase
MAITWELRDYDHEFFYRELDSFVPHRVFDAHAHLYEIGHWGVPHAVSAGPAVVTMDEFLRQIEWIMPGREVTGLFFGVAFHSGYAACNDFVAREALSRPGNFCEMVVPPDLDPEQMRETVRRRGFRGIKVYHTFVPQKPTWNAEIPQYLSEEHVRVAHEENWTITLHMVRDRALSDPANLDCIVRYCRQYPGIRLILAHAARGFNAFHTVNAVDRLRGLDNVWCDVSAVTEAPAMEAIVAALGPEKLLWGSDYPISHLRGRCIAIGDQFVWLYEDTLDWQRVSPQSKIQPYFVGHESLRSLKHTATVLRLSDSEIEGIFYTNATRMLGACRNQESRLSRDI